MNTERRAQILAESSLNSKGLLDIVRVRAALEIISEEKSELKRLRLLRLYKKRASLMLAQERAEIQYAGKPSAEHLAKLEAFLKGRAGKDVEVKMIENQTLLAGVKLVSRDDIWENSARLELEKLESDTAKIA